MTDTGLLALDLVPLGTGDRREAAARAGFEAVAPWYGFPTGFDRAPEPVKDAYRAIARAALRVGLPAELAGESGVSYAAVGVYLALLACPDGVADPAQLAGRGLTAGQTADAVEELIAHGLVERRQA